MIYNSRMLCEGSPLLFYTPWGPVTPMGMYRGARRLSQQTGESRGADRRVKIYSSCPRLSRPVYGSLPRQSGSGQAEIQARQRSRPGRDPGQADIQAGQRSRPGRHPGRSQIKAGRRSRPGRDPGLGIDRLLLLYILFPDALRG